MEYFKSLPVEITLNILSRIPTEWVLECKLVCTEWNNLVRHEPLFSKMHCHHHLNHPSHSAVSSGKLFGFVALTRDESFHYFEYDENYDESTTPIQRVRRINVKSPFRKTTLVGSCNGLICLADEYPSICICNPITRECVMLPEIHKDWGVFDRSCWMNGFGYVSLTNEYKVVGMYTYETHTEVYLYSLGSGNGWKKLEKFNLKSSTFLTQCVFANGALYRLDRLLDTVINFDLAEEKFLENLSPPPVSPGTFSCCDQIGVLNGFLFSSIRVHDEENAFPIIRLLEKKNDIFVMKERDEHQSFVWSKEFRIDGSKLESNIYHKLFAVTKDGGVLIYGDCYLKIYDTKTSTTKSLVKFKDCLRQVSSHQNTLVSLKELGEECTKPMESVETQKTRSRGYPFEQFQEDASPEYIYL